MNKITTTHEKFMKIYTIWYKDLSSLSNEDLKKRESSISWTLGQLYNHLINSVLNFHLKQIENCINSTENSNERKTFKGFIGYKILKSFPPIKISVPPSDSYTPKHPIHKNELLEGFEKVRIEMDTIRSKFPSNKNGKSKHPAFGYLNAEEWYMLIEMHWKHHLRQKISIEKMNTNEK